MNWFKTKDGRYLNLDLVRLVSKQAKKDNETVVTIVFSKEDCEYLSDPSDIRKLYAILKSH